jgi:N-methylhydantoinase A
MTLDEAATARAIHSIARHLGLDDVALAQGMLSIINAKMADAMRTITVAHGIDPREYSLLAFGGAGPMHAVWLAEELDMGEVIVPFSPGTFSASGMLQTDVRHDLAYNFYRLLSEVSPQTLTQAYAELVEEGHAVLCAEGIPPEDMYFEYSSDMRYVGQEYSVSVRIGKEIKLDEIDQAFHEAYRVRYGHATPGAPVEFVTLRAAAWGMMKKKLAGFHPFEDGRDPIVDERQVIFQGEPHRTPILRRQWMPVDQVYRGPLVIEEDSATTVLPPGYQCRVDQFGNILIVRSDAS